MRGTGDTFQEKRHERDLGRFHPLEGFPIGFVVQRWILKKDSGTMEEERKWSERKRLEKEKRFQYLFIRSEHISSSAFVSMSAESHRDKLQL